MLNKNENIFGNVFFKTLKPKKKQTVSEWADNNRVLSQKSSAEPGKWRTSRTPYLQEIMDNLSSHSGIQKTVFIKGAQIGGTECGNNWVGYVIDHAPGPMMFVQPTDDDVKTYSQVRIDPLIEETPALSSKVSSKRERDSGNTTKMKMFPGGFLRLASANSPSQLRSLPIRYLFMDEVDGYPGDCGGEGDPVDLAMKRTNTFSSRKRVFLCSTPLEQSTSRIERAYIDSDQRQFHVPCPDCGEYQVLKFDNLKWPEDDPHAAEYCCEHCGVMIPEHKKSFMLQNGKWVAQNPGHKNGTIRGYHLSSLYSPLGWLSWGEIADQFIEAKKDREKLKTFVNTVLGETWKDKGEAPDWHRLYERREDYKINSVPDGVVFLTAAADVQKGRVEVEIKGWGRNKNSWSIDHRVIPMDAEDENAWGEVDKLLGEQWSGLSIRLFVIDSGYATQSVYNFCRKYSPSRVRAIKGSDNLTTTFGVPKNLDVKFNGKTWKNGVQLWPVGSSHIKKEVYGWFRQNVPTNDDWPVGFCHFPQYDEEYFKQLTAEQLVVKMVKGYRKYYWEKERERNEALDLMVYNRAAAAMIGIDRFGEEDFKTLEQQNKNLEPIKTKAETQAAKPQKKKKRQSNFW